MLAYNCSLQKLTFDIYVAYKAQAPLRLTEPLEYWLILIFANFIFGRSLIYFSWICFIQVHSSIYGVVFGDQDSIDCRSQMKMFHQPQLLQFWCKAGSPPVMHQGKAQKYQTEWTSNLDCQNCIRSSICRFPWQWYAK